MKQRFRNGGHEIVVERIVLISRRDNTSLRWRGFLLEGGESRRSLVDGERWLTPSKRGWHEEGDGRARRGGLSKFRLNSPRINIRNGAPGCYKLACCPLLSFLDSTICTPGPVTSNHKLRLFRECSRARATLSVDNKRTFVELCPPRKTSHRNDNSYLVKYFYENKTRMTVFHFFFFFLVTLRFIHYRLVACCFPLPKYVKRELKERRIRPGKITKFKSVQCSLK